MEHSSDKALGTASSLQHKVCLSLPPSPPSSLSLSAMFSCGLRVIKVLFLAYGGLGDSGLVSLSVFG